MDRLIDGARRGDGGGVLVHGEPGIGKTVLLEYAAEQAAGMRILRCAGVESERDLGYASLHQLLRPVSEQVGELPIPQAEALRVVFGQLAGQSPDRFLVALATLSLVSQTADHVPVLCLIDDAQWIDRPSLEVVTFLARRLEAEPVALVVTARSGGQSPPMNVPGLSDLPLSGLDVGSARELLADQIGEPVTPEQQEALMRATGGNPLAIRELSVAKLRSVESGAPLLVTDQLRRAFHERVHRLSPADQRLLLLVACDGSGRIDVLQRAAQAFDVSLDSLATGVLDNVLHVDGATVSFRHPLIRS
ncbi:MAG: AAA family ATPase, partial [Pseudonocardia sp.]|nr:AAA family ATPase [Pseudonocardia sp.]